MALPYRVLRFFCAHPFRQEEGYFVLDEFVIIWYFKSKFIPVDKKITIRRMEATFHEFERKKLFDSEGFYSRRD